MRKSLAVFAFVALACPSACIHTVPATPVSPPATIVTAVTIQLPIDWPSSPTTVAVTLVPDVCPQVAVPAIAAGLFQATTMTCLGTGAVMRVTAADASPFTTPRFVIPTSGNLVLPSAQLTLSLPPVPTRESILAFKLQFQGMTVCGMPWFEAALFSLPASCPRSTVYAAKHLAGDTHAIIAGMQMVGSVYNEPGNPYQAMNWNPLLAGTGLHDAVVEVLQNGFWPEIVLDGDGAYTQCQTYQDDPQGYGNNNYPGGACTSLLKQQLAQIIPLLQHASEGDLTSRVLLNWGWDSVFYGYSPNDLLDLVAYARSLCPACYFGFEFNTGHLPWEAMDMSGYDWILVEFNDTVIHGNATWGILGRLLGPMYHRPPEDSQQNNGNDTNPRPWILAAGTPRGAFGVACFESGAYEFVRDDEPVYQATLTNGTIEAPMTPPDVAAYFTTLGCGTSNASVVSAVD